MTIMNLAIQTARRRFLSLFTLIALMMVSPMTAQSDELGIEILTAGQGEVAKVWATGHRPLCRSPRRRHDV